MTTTTEEPTTFEECHEQYRGMIYGYILSNLRNKEQAEDLTQEVFVSVAGAFDSYKSGNMANWLRTIARSKIIAYVREYKSKKRRMDMLVPLEEAQELCNMGSPEQQVIFKEEIQEYFDSLPNDLSRKANLLNAQGYPVREIASMLHEPIGRISWYVYYRPKGQSHESFS